MFVYTLIIFGITKLIAQSSQWETIIIPGKILGIPQMDTTIDANCHTILWVCRSRNQKDHLGRWRKQNTRLVYKHLFSPHLCIDAIPRKFHPFFGPLKFPTAGLGITPTRYPSTVFLGNGSNDLSDFGPVG